MIKSYVTRFIFQVIAYLHKLFNYSDNQIHQCILTYKADADKSLDPSMNKFWKSESRYWSGVDEYFCDITHVDARDIDDTPENVTNYNVTVKYSFSGKIFKYLSPDKCPSWPVDHSKRTPHICMPIKRADVLDVDDKPVIDITKKIKRYAGPMSNFYCNTLRVRDIMTYDPEIFPRIKITNILGHHSVLNMEDGEINIQKMFSLPDRS